MVSSGENEFAHSELSSEILLTDSYWQCTLHIFSCLAVYFFLTPVGHWSNVRNVMSCRDISSAATLEFNGRNFLGQTSTASVVNVEQSPFSSLTILHLFNNLCHR